MSLAAAFAIVTSEFTSNTASANMVVPVVIAVAQQSGSDPLIPALAATVACTFGFMLPVSTPTNAMAYATGHGRPVDLVAAHKWLNIAAIKGCDRAVDLRADLAMTMSKSDLAAALRAAREWMTVH